jgi:hypothetical protein
MPYFACIEHAARKEMDDGRVWAMLPHHAVHLDPFEIAEKPDEKALFARFASTAIKLVHPFYNSPRLLAQDGAFTIQSNPWKSIESYKDRDFREGNLDIEKLWRWKIPGEDKVAIIEELSGLGITHRMLFPDLDGIARSLWETEVLWHGEPTP